MKVLLIALMCAMMFSGCGRKTANDNLVTNTPMENVEENIDNAKDEVTDGVEEAKDKIEIETEKAKDSAEENLEGAKDSIEEGAERIEEPIVDDKAPNT